LARYDFMQADEARRLKALETENERRKRLVARLALDKQTLQEVVQKMLTADQRRQLEDGIFTVAQIYIF
jgi:hypothetical protein